MCVCVRVRARVRKAPERKRKRERAEMQRATTRTGERAASQLVQRAPRRAEPRGVAGVQRNSPFESTPAAG